MADIIDAALAYAEAGWPVLALYTNTPEGCSCGDTKCTSPGKHPQPKLSPKGVHSATRSKQQIEKWPEDINIGIALGKKSLAIDVDEAAAARAILDPEFALHQATGLAASGRGAHVHFTCKEETRTFNLKTTAGIEIGQVRGVGSYVVAPPSMSTSGRPYKWVGLPKDVFVPPHLQSTDDPLAYAVNLFAQVGIDLLDDLDLLVGFEGDVPTEKLEAIVLPERFWHRPGMQDVRSMCDGYVSPPPKGGRSGELYKAGVRVAEVARKEGLALTRRELAGIVKQVDIAYADKLAGDVRERRRSQASADKECWRIAYKVLDDDLSARPQEPSEGPEGNKPIRLVTRPEIIDEAPTKPAQYYLDERDWILYYKPSPKRDPVEIANFMLKITHQVAVERGEDISDPEVAWMVQVVRKDRSEISFLLSSREKENTPSFERAINKRLSARDIVRPKMYDHLKTAMQELSTNIDEDVVYAHAGWIEFGGSRCFLLPSSEGAVGQDRMVTEARIDFAVLSDENITDEDLQGYGKGVRIPNDTDEEAEAVEAFRHLVTCGKIEVTLPVALQVLGGPLYPAGIDEVPPLLHVMGRTGSLKTSYSKAALSMMGTFREGDAAPAMWGSTANSLRTFLHVMKDTTLLIDDFKVAHVDKAITKLIQNYADKSSRRRQTPRQRLQHTERPRGLILSNGEDVWESEASVVARSVSVSVHPEDIIDELLAEAQRDVITGRMQLFGGMWLSWLAKQDDLFSGRELEEGRKKWLDYMRGRVKAGELHRRLLGSFASLCAIGDVLLQFIREVAPKYEEETKGWLKQIIAAFVEQTLEHAEEVASLSPLRQFATIILGEMAAGTAVFRPAEGIDASHKNYPDRPSSKATIIGWHRERKELYLSKERTYAFVEEVMRRRGRVVPFSWNAVLQELRNGTGGLTSELRRVASDEDGAKSQLRFAIVSIDEFERAGTDALVESDDSEANGK